MSNKNTKNKKIMAKQLDMFATEIRYDKYSRRTVYLELYDRDTFFEIYILHYCVSRSTNFDRINKYYSLKLKN